MANSLVLVIATAGIALSLLVVPLLLLSHPYGDRRANRFLAIFVSILAIKLSQRALLYSGALEVYPGLSGVGRFLYFALAPLLYFYICALTKEGFALRRAQYWHFFPVLLAFLAMLPIYFLGAEAKRELAENYFRIFPDGVDIFAILAQANEYTAIVYIHLVLYISLPIHLMVYSVLGLRQVHRHWQRIGERFSNTDRIQLRWIQALCYFALLLCLASLAWFLLFITGRAEDLRSLPAMVTTLLIYCIGLMSLRQPRVYAANSAVNSAGPERVEAVAEEEEAPRVASRKYQSSGLSEADSEQLWQRLQQYMDAEKPYLIPSLTIGQLSASMDVPSAHLSQVINTHSSSNFFDFVNSYRVQHAKTLMRETLQSKTKMLTIALDSGFNSQSTFYAQFKKHCGGTPAQYRRSLRNQGKEEAIPTPKS